MKNETGYYYGRENRKLFFQYWLPDGNVKAYIIAIHGWGTHSDRMKIPAEYFTEKEYAIYSFDLRGHWRNTGDFAGHIDSMDHLHKDVVLFMDVVKETAANKKIFLMGNSFGGLIALIYAIHHIQLPGVLVSSPLLGLSEKMSFSKKMTNKMSAKFSPTKTVPFVIDQKDLTSDLKILRTYLADKRKLEIITAKSFVEMDKSMKWAMENASELRCPCLIMQAGKEKFADLKKTKKFFNKVTSKDKTFKLYDGLLHEIWYEKARTQVYQDMYIWLEKHK
ncbi:MAG: alpha/beta fold hydrolase [Promethearchaeota archaeon]